MTTARPLPVEPILASKRFSPEIPSPFQFLRRASTAHGASVSDYSPRAFRMQQMTFICLYGGELCRREGRRPTLPAQRAGANSCPRLAFAGDLALMSKKKKLLLA